MTIVLLPGLDGMGALFAPFIEALGPRVETIVVSYPTEGALGYGALEPFARAQLPPGRRYFLLGESFSGPIAIAIAAARPDGLLGLVLAASFARNPHPYFVPLKALIRVLPVSAKLSGLISPLLLGRHASRQTLSALRQSLECVSAESLRMRLRTVLEVDYSAQFAQLRVPVLYLRATGDRVVFASACAHIAALLPQVTIVPIKGPHLLLQALPAAAAQAVGQFMRRVSAAARAGGD